MIHERKVQEHRKSLFIHKFEFNFLLVGCTFRNIVKRTDLTVALRSDFKAIMTKDSLTHSLYLELILYKIFKSI